MPTQAEIVESLGNMSVTQILDLTHILEEQWGVKAAPQVTQALPPAPPPETKVEAQTEFTVTLLGAGLKKIDVIKVVRTLMAMGLGEAKAFVEEASEEKPKTIKDSISKADAEEIKTQLEAAGAVVKVS